MGMETGASGGVAGSGRRSGSASPGGPLSSARGYSSTSRIGGASGGSTGVAGFASAMAAAMAVAAAQMEPAIISAVAVAAVIAAAAQGFMSPHRRSMLLLLPVEVVVLLTAARPYLLRLVIPVMAR